ncbi:MAG: VWA domain-containing protein, partial [Lachnospiraceae bacterium]|nr:VWA domain-containing protein [Lachnospiraceae bacterium]
MDISFERPIFLLLIPVVIGLLIFSMSYMIAQNKKTRISQVVVRCVLAIALILALAQVSLKWVGRDVTTIFLVDVSDSVREQREEVIRFVNDAVKEKDKHDYIGVIAFGSDTRVEQFISQDISFAEFQTDVSTEATDLEEAVNMALAEMPEDSARRIVLITDGNENEGSIRNTASMVVAAGCDFEVKKLEENIANEVYVSDLSVPEEVGVGENFNINVEVESNVACQAVVSLYSGRTLKGQQTVMLQSGTNRFVFMDTQTDEGLKTYRVTVEAKEDTVSINNEFSAYTNIEVELPILVVEGKDGQATEFRGILDS